MKGDFVRQITLYKYRYVVGYGSLAIIMTLMAGWQFWSLPSGLSSAEMTTATTSAGLSWSVLSGIGDLVNLPANILQSMSIHLFGFNSFAFRLPAVILAIFSGMGLIWLVRRWLGDNIAVISGFLTVTSVIFPSLARGTAGPILTVFWLIVILLAITKLLTTDKLRADLALALKVVTVLAASLLLYSPSGIYWLVAVMLVGFLHPKVRLVIIRAKSWQWLVGGLLGLIIIWPLLASVIWHGQTGVLGQLFLTNGDWAGLESLPLVFWFRPDFAGGWILPIVTVAEIMLAIIGLITISRVPSAARSQVILALLITSLVIAARSAELIFLLYLPLVLMMAIGIKTLTSSWYRLFPNNPYARTFALLPLVILIGGLVLTNIARYLSVNNYLPAAVYSYNQEFEAARQLIKNQKIPLNLVVKSSEKPFYDNLQPEFAGLTISTKSQTGMSNLVLESSAVRPDSPIRQIVTDWRQQQAVLLRLYD
jgi:hypothetical protein